MTTEFSELRAHWAHLKDLLRRKGSREEGRKEGRREEKTERGRKERRQVRNLHTDSIFTGFTFPPSSVKRYNRNCNIPFSSVQLISYVQLFATPWISARQASLSIINSQSLLKLMSIELVMPSNYLILCCPLCLQSFPASGCFPTSKFFASGGQRIEVSASASVLSMNIQD